MIPAISSAKAKTYSDYNVNFGQLRPKKHMPKDYNNQSNPKNPAFGISGKHYIIALPLVAVISGFFGWFAGPSAASFLDKAMKTAQTNDLCLINKDTENVQCAVSCAMSEHKNLFADAKENLRRINKYCTKSVKQAL